MESGLIDRVFFCFGYLAAAGPEVEAVELPLPGADAAAPDADCVEDEDVEAG